MKNLEHIGNHFKGIARDPQILLDFHRGCQRFPESLQDPQGKGRKETKTNIYIYILCFPQAREGPSFFFLTPPLLVLLHKTGRLRKANVNNRIMKVYGRNVKWRNRLLSIRTEYERKKRVLKEKNNVQNSFEVREDDGILTELCKIYIVSKWQVAQRHDVAWEVAWRSMSSCQKRQKR